MDRRLTLSLVLAIALLPVSPTRAQEAGGISSLTLSRCADKVGGDSRQVDPAFGIIMLDGMPWVTIERTEEKMGTQMIATTVTGTGTRGRRDGTGVPFRFTCLLDQRGQPVMFHATQVLSTMGDALPPATIVAGTATATQPAAPTTTPARGAELRVQLIDIARAPAGDILTEQLVRSSWPGPIPFALRLPKETALEGRKLAITARLVTAQQMLFRLSVPRPIGGDDFRTPIELTLEKAAAGKR